MPEVRISASLEHAALALEATEFYFGCEFGRDDDGHEVWGFTAKRDGRTIARIAHADMRDVLGCPEDREQCLDNLLFGIGLFLAGMTGGVA